MPSSNYVYFIYCYGDCKNDSWIQRASLTDGSTSTKFYSPNFFNDNYLYFSMLEMSDGDIITCATNTWIQKDVSNAAECGRFTYDDSTITIVWSVNVRAVDVDMKHIRTLSYADSVQD